jgi:ATP-dependent DNA ligase
MSRPSSRGNVIGRRENGRVQLPVMPPVSPMLAKPVRSIPPGASYEPKWDGFRTICFRDGDDDFTGRPFSVRRAALVDALTGSGPSIHVTPATTDLATAQRWFDEFEGAGLDGIIAKPLTITYQPDKRVMFKIKHERTAGRFSLT